MAPSPGPITCGFPVVVDAANRLVGGRPFDPPGDVFDAAVRVRVRGPGSAGCRRHVETTGPGRISSCSTRGSASLGGAAPLADPLAQDAVFERAGSEPHAPLVGDCPGGLGQEQAPAGIGELDAPAAVLLDDVEVIGRRIIAAEREPEAPFARQCAVARTRVAPCLASTGST